MKTIKYFPLIAALFIQGIFSLQAQNTAGKEFWLTFGKFHVSPAQINLLQMQIRFVCGSNPTTVTIYFTNLKKTFTFSMSANGIYDYILDNTEKLAVYNTEMGITDNSIFIKSTEPVTVYSYINRAQFPEVTNVLPVTALSTEYYQISYFVHNPLLIDAYAVVATQSNTQLYHNGSPSVTLEVGEVYYRPANTDMTGVCVSANKPVAFFSLHQGVNIPFGALPVINSPLMQQMPPAHTLGKTFFVPVTNIGKEFVRIVATQNNTTITQTGGTKQTGVPGANANLANLQAGDFVELEVYLDSAGCYIQANKPVGVCSYMPTTAYINFPYPLPSQCWIPGIEQTVPNAQMAPFVPKEPFFPDPQLAHYALIITPTATKTNTKVSVGGALPVSVSGGTWKDNTNAGMSFYSMPLSEIDASYTFTNQEGIIVFGWAISTNTFPASYYYLAYSAMRDLQATFYANDISYQLLKENDFCEGDVHFLAEIEGLHPTHPERITWWIEGTEYLPAKTLDNWNKYFSAGTYEIRMDVIFDNNETASKTGTLIIKSCNQTAAFFVNNVLHSELKDTTFCNKNVNFRTEIEGLHPTASERIKWYVDSKDGNGFIEETSALNQTQWSKPFENGTYEIKLVVHYDNDTYATLTGTLKIQALWIKIRNVRY